MCVLVTSVQMIHVPVSIVFCAAGHDNFASILPLVFRCQDGRGGDLAARIKKQEEAEAGREVHEERPIPNLRSFDVFRKTQGGEGKGGQNKQEEIQASETGSACSRITSKCSISTPWSRCLDVVAYWHPSIRLMGILSCCFFVCSSDGIS